jgi:UPF0271 protein
MAFILDASAILNNPSFYFGKGKYFISPSVLLEIKEEKAKILTNDAIRRGVLEVKEPSLEFVEKVVKKAAELGEELSKADIDTLALAMEKGDELVTDDYGIQNAAEFLGIRYLGALFEKIHRKIRWSLRCSKCGRRYDKGKVCRICGGKLLRKALSKESEDFLSKQ